MDIINQEFDIYARIIDLILSGQVVKKAFYEKGHMNWIDKVEIHSLRNGLNSLEEYQIEIIEGLLIEKRCFLDMCVRFDITSDELQEEIQKMYVTLIKHI